MGRRNQHSTEEFKELVLSTLEQHLVTDAAQSLSLRKLAEQVGYAPGMLISVFKSYSELLLQVNARTLDEMHHKLVTQLKAINSAELQLHTLAQGYLAFAVQHPYRWQLVFDHKMPNGEVVPEWMQARINHLFELIAHSLQQLKPTEKKQHIAVSAHTLWASVHGITQLAINDKLFVDPSIDGKQMLEQLLNHFLTGWLNVTNKKGAHHE